MPNLQERLVAIKTSTIVKVVIVLLALGFLWLVRDVIALLFVALFLAALMHPAADWGAKRRIPKGLTVLLIYLILIALVSASFALIVPTVLSQVGNLSDVFRSLITTVSTGVQSVRALTEQYGFLNNLSSSVAALQQQASLAAGGVFNTLFGIFGGIAGLIIVLVMAFYMVVEEKEAVRLFQNLVPGKFQDVTAKIISQVEVKIGQWLSGQFMLSLTIGILYYIGLLVLGVEGALTLAVFAGFLEFIPYLGPILGGIPIVIVALSDSPIKALLALGLVILIQQLENHIIAPKLMQKAVGLNPLVSIVAVLIGAKLFGLVGVLLAVPVATAVSVILNAMYLRHEKVD
jgi:predicted PurR-regulated permease PerM